jgi:hypothetical protein
VQPVSSESVRLAITAGKARSFCKAAFWVSQFREVGREPRLLNGYRVFSLEPIPQGCEVGSEQISPKRRFPGSNPEREEQTGAEKNETLHP